MSWLETLRKEAERYNAAVRETVERRKAEIAQEKRDARLAAYNERERKRKAKYQREHREQTNEARRKWIERTGWDAALYMREWTRKHPGKSAEYCRRYRANKRKAKEAGNGDATQD